MNQDRGTNPYISDRWDLTLECIKRYYGQPENDNRQCNPLWKTIKRSEEFFNLFVDFNGYIGFFFLQDFVDENGNVIRFMPDYFDGNGNFTKKYPVPQTAGEYLQNIEAQKGIISKRNARIQRFVQNQNRKMLSTGGKNLSPDFQSGLPALAGRYASARHTVGQACRQGRIAANSPTLNNQVVRRIRQL